jgi:branched-subunit amino acid aminotransferase/4-amino-4-deoxychorismate lyase
VSGSSIHVEINGEHATAAQLAHPALVNYGHFTAMQVRGGRTRGLQLHLRRLEDATKELFDVNLEPDRVRDHIRHALADTRDASIRVNVFWPNGRTSVSVLVAVSPPVQPPEAAQSLMTVPYQRPLPHIKHVGSFAQTHYRRRARRHGHDEALLTGPQGTISEGAISNIAFSHAGTLIWPDSPCLVGTTMQLLERRLHTAGVATRRSTVYLSDLPTFAGAFVVNSTGIAAVSRIDETAFPTDPAALDAITRTYESIPWDLI